MIDVNITPIPLHIVGLVYGAPALSLGTLYSIRLSSSLPYHLRLKYSLMKMFESIVPLDYPFSDFYKFIENVSYFELPTIAYSFLISTFSDLNETGYKKTMKCVSCESEIYYDYDLSDFMSGETKVWDKNEHFRTYLFTYSDKNLMIYFRIPSIVEYLNFLGSFNESTIEENYEKYSNELDPISELSLLTKEINVKGINLTLKDEIKRVRKPLGLDDTKANRKFVENEIFCYKPNFGVEVVCNNCGAKIQLKLFPFKEFISASDKVSKQIKEIVDMYNVLLTVTEQKMNSLQDFLNMPYPLYLKISDQLIKDYRRKVSLLKSKKTNLEKGGLR